MTKEDSAERNDSLGATDNSATIRTILALRYVCGLSKVPLLSTYLLPYEEKLHRFLDHRKVIYSHGSFCKNLRIVVQLNSPCPFLETIPLISPEGEMVTTFERLVCGRFDSFPQSCRRLFYVAPNQPQPLSKSLIDLRDT